MCVLAPYSNAILWLFLGGAICMAVLSRKLNDHLLVPPKPATSIWFRRKHYIKPSFLLRPDLHFDAAGQPLAWRVAVLAAITFASFLVLMYLFSACRPAAAD